MRLAGCQAFQGTVIGKLCRTLQACSRNHRSQSEGGVVWHNEARFAHASDVYIRCLSEWQGFLSRRRATTRWDGEPGSERAARETFGELEGFHLPLPHRIPSWMGLACESSRGHPSSEAENLQTVLLASVTFAPASRDATFFLSNFLQNNQRIPRYRYRPCRYKKQRTPTAAAAASLQGNARGFDPALNALKKYHERRDVGKMGESCDGVVRLVQYLPTSASLSPLLPRYLCKTVISVQNYGLRATPSG